jgi:hypothetical protein
MRHFKGYSAAKTTMMVTVVTADFTIATHGFVSDEKASSVAIGPRRTQIFIGQVNEMAESDRPIVDYIAKDEISDGDEWRDQSLEDVSYAQHCQWWCFHGRGFFSGIWAIGKGTDDRLLRCRSK